MLQEDEVKAVVKALTDLDDWVCQREHKYGESVGKLLDEERSRNKEIMARVDGPQDHPTYDWYDWYMLGLARGYGGISHEIRYRRRRARSGLDG